jgi:predicted HicB family RNase H-like nuclease
MRWRTPLLKAATKAAQKQGLTFNEFAHRALEAALAS